MTKNIINKAEMNLNLIFFFFILFQISTQNATSTSTELAKLDKDEPGHCIWYGVCDFDKATGHKRYCNYTGPAKPLNNEGQKLLSIWCPHLLTDDGNGVNTCCDSEMVNICGFFLLFV